MAESIDPLRDQLVVVWYAVDPVWGVPHAIPVLRETAILTGLPSGQGGPITSRRRYDDIRFDNDCLSSGDYIAEFYLNGNLSAREAIRVELGDFDRYRSREMNASLCHPKGWKVWPGSKARDRMHDLARAFIDDKNVPVALVMSFFAPRDLPEEERKAYFLRRALRYVSEKTGSDLARMTRGAAAFHTCDRPFSGERLLHKEWITGDGMVYVGLVFEHNAPGGLACQIFESIGNYFVPENLEEMPRKK
jgi:hypothetical protein